MVEEKIDHSLFSADWPDGPVMWFRELGIVASIFIFVLNEISKVVYKAIEFFFDFLEHSDKEGAWAVL